MLARPLILARQLILARPLMLGKTIFLSKDNISKLKLKQAYALLG